MNVLLASLNREDFPDPVYPIGVGLVAAAAIDAGHGVRVVDLRWEPTALEQPPEAFEPDVVGLSIRNVDNLTWQRSCSYVGEFREVVRDVRTWFRGPVVLGGSGYSLFPQVLLEALGCEFGVVGEGELSFPALLEAIAAGGDPSSLPGVVVRGRAPHTERSLLPAPPGGFREGCGDLVALYTRTGAPIGVQTKRGCPFECTYCTYPALEGKALRLREPSDVIEELRELAGYGVQRVFFVDDAFNVPADHAEAICRLMVEARLPIAWSAFTYPRALTTGLTSWMRRSGCAGLEFGTDSLSDPVLEELRKGFSVQDVLEAAATVAREGIPSAHYLLLGGPGETPETLRQGLAESHMLPPAAFIAMVGVRIYPGTKLEARSRAEGLVAPHQSLLDPTFYLSPLVEASHILDVVRQHALRRRTWIVPAAGIRSDPSVVERGRELGWPAWRMLLRQPPPRN